MFNRCYKEEIHDQTDYFLTNISIFGPQSSTYSNQQKKRGGHLTLLFVAKENDDSSKVMPYYLLPGVNVKICKAGEAMGVIIYTNCFLVIVMIIIMYLLYSYLGKT